MLPKYRRLVETLAQAGPAQGHLRYGHPRRRHQRADPHGAVHRPVEVRRGADPAAQGPRVPPDRRPGRAGRLRHPRHGHRAGPRARHRQRADAGQGRRRPEEAAQGGPQEAAGGQHRLGPAHLRPAGRRRPGAADLVVPGVARDAAQRAGPRRRPVRGDAAPADRQPRGAGRPAPAHPPGHRDRPGAARRRRHRAHRHPGRASVPAGRRPAARLRAQPGAVAVRAGLPGAARPGVAGLPAGRGVGDRVDAGGPAPGAVRAAAEGPRRGGQRDEGRGHRVRPADGAARGRHPPAAAAASCWRRRTRRTGAGTRGSPTTSSSPRASSATCTSGR